jgi:Complex 1 protein (LYR family)
MPPKIWLPNSKALETTSKHLTSSVRRSEALSLYREILRTAKHFHWADDKSKRPWNQILREQARREFEASRKEEDPLVIARLLVTGRDCLQQVQIKFNDATQAAWKRIDKDSKR